MNERLTKEWIEKVNKDFKEIAEKAQRDRWKINNAYPGVKRGQKKYLTTLKGRRARKKVLCTRASRFKMFILSPQETKMIQDFYLECPEGFQVDHIFPLSRGGIHSLSNLQWLTKEENIKKGPKLNYKVMGRVECRCGVDEKYFFKVNQRKAPSKYRRMRNLNERN